MVNSLEVILSITINGWITKHLFSTIEEPSAGYVHITELIFVMRIKFITHKALSVSVIKVIIVNNNVIIIT